MGTAGQSITLANSIIGVGILAMPFCFQQCGVLLATLILLSMGLISRLCCYFLLKSALLARRRNFEFLAFHVFGSAGKLAVEVGIIGFLMGTCIAYFVVVGDLGPQIIAKLFNINQSDILRTSIMVLVSLLCVLPMGLLRNVDSLSNVSAATIGFYFCLVMKVIAEAASQLLTGEWHTRMELWKPSGVLQCVPIFSMALFCQTQLFEIFESLPSLSLEKMNLVTKNAINICTGVYFTLGVFGYIAFCSQQISGNILMSLSPTLASDVIKLGFVMSLAFSFPLIIFPCRASLYSLLYKKVHSSHHDHIINHSIPESSFRCITVAIIAVTLFISLLIPNIELVLGLVGSTIGVLICIVFPAACFINVTFKNTNERVLAKVILAFGLIIMILGTYANLQAAESQKDKYDDRYITKERIDKIVEDFFEKREKSDDAVKPIAKNDPHSNEIKQNGNALLESEVQPPNPVPPESQSNEKPKKKEEVKLDSKLNVLAEPEKDVLDKVSETHPKNLNKLNEVKANNAESNIEKNKIEKLNEEKIKTASNEENMKKQQQLIETIKQHGEEQKELIKEQKEILDEIMKTKKEQQKEDKNEVDSLAAKRIAVESIKKIADMAIQSLSGVTEKPVGEVVEDKKAEHIEELADKAVQEIAKKAVETIEAIKEINVKADVPVSKSDNQPVPVNNIIAPASGSNVLPSNPKQVVQNVNNDLPVNPSLAEINNVAVGNQAQSVNNNKPPVQPAKNQLLEIGQQLALNVQQQPMNIQQSASNIQQPPVNTQQPAENAQQPNSNAQQSAVNAQQPAANVQLSAANAQEPAVNAQQSVVNAQQPAVNVQQAASNGQQPAANVQQPAVNVQQAPSNGQQPAANFQQPAVNVQQAASNGQQPAANVQQPAANVQKPAANVKEPAANVQQPAANVQEPATNVQQSVVNIQRRAANVQQPAANVQQPAMNVQQQPGHVQQAVVNAQQPSSNVNLPVANQPAMNYQQSVVNGNGQNTLPKQPIENAPSPINNNNQNGQLPVNKRHSHSPDEPQSYKEGEEAQNKNSEAVQLNDMIKNIPLPLSKENSNNILQKGKVALQEPLKPSNNNNPNGAIDNDIRNKVLNRQKREVVDCTEKTTLKPEDKQICEKFINVPHIKTDVKDDLPKIDFNDVALPKSLPIDANLIHHLRSLKSYDVKDNDR